MDIEQEARNLGWRPQEEYNGPEGRWLPADAFVERGRSILAIANKNNETLQAQIAELRTSVAEAAAAAVEFRKYHEETAERAYAKAIADLNAQKVDALEKGEFGRATEIDDNLRKLEVKAPTELKQTEPTSKGPDPKLDPVYVAWAAEHPWVAENGEKTKYAASMGQYIRATTSLTGKAFLDRVAEEVEARFAGNGEGEPTRRPASRVEGGTRGNGRIAGKSFADLPPEAKAACDRFGARLTGPGKAYKTLADWRTQYVTDYDWSSQ